MNICLVSTYGVECGIATYTAALAKALKAQGHSVVVLAEIKDKQPVQEVIDGIPVYRLWWRTMHEKTMYGLSAILRALDSSPQKPDVVHIQHEFGLFPNNAVLLNLLLELRQRGIPTVVTFHTMFRAPGGCGFFGKLAYKQAIIVHTAEAAAAFASFAGEGRAFVVPHGVECCQERPDDRTNKVLVPGFISKNKGHIEIIEGFAEYLANSFDGELKLQIMGLCRDDLYLTRLKQTLAHYCLDEAHVELKLGFHSEVELSRAFAAADFVILGGEATSPYSASGQLASAIGHGVPVLAKNTPIYRSGGDAGVVLYNEGELPAFIKAFATNNSLLALLAAKHRAVAAERTWDKVAAQHIQIYGEL